MTQEELLLDLVNTYLRLKPSPVNGIGVFAIRDIPKGCRNMFSLDNGDWLAIPHEEIIKLPGYSQELIRHYCVSDSLNYYIDRNGFKKLDLIHFVNHSDNPNITPINNGECYECLRDIKAGEELFLNYTEIETT